MAQFRVLGAADVSQILGAFGIPSDAYLGHQGIAAGTINTNLRVDTRLGPRFLRVNEGKARDDVAREADIVSYLQAAGVPTPLPYRASVGVGVGVGTGAGQRYWPWGDLLVSLFPWVQGRTLSRAEVTPGHAAQVGRALAQLHLAGLDFPDRRPGRYEPIEIERRLEEFSVQASADPQIRDAVALLKPELTALARERVEGLPSGLIHGDLFIDNVLFEGDRLVALLDFEQASWGRLTYDLAVTTMAFGFGRDDFRPEIVRAMLDAYAAERPPGPLERAAFGAELRFVACRFAVTRITDVYLKRGAGAAPGKDFRRYLDRLARVREHLQADDGVFQL